MKIPTNVADIAEIDWTSAEVQHLTLRDLRAWDDAAAARRVVLPPTDEAAWEGTELDVQRTVL